MRRRLAVVALAGAAVAWGAGPLAVPGAASVWAATAGGATARADAGAVQTATSWGRAVYVPGLGVLNRGGNANVVSVSCTSAVNCSAGGYYRDQHHHDQGFVVTERHGSWGRAAELPGLGALNNTGNASVVSVSCTSAGNCSAGGTYRGGSSHASGFVATEKEGRWDRAIEVPGLGGLSPDGKAAVVSVSCAEAGNCAATGNYTDSDGQQQGFVVNENNGRWGQAIEIPGLGTLDNGSADATEVSCAAAGNCAAVGLYTDSAGHEQGFVADQQSGSWGQAIEVPGLGALNQGDGAAVLAVSCAAAGNCAAGGYYTDSSGNEQGFVADRQAGSWGQAIEVPGLGALNETNNDPLAYVGSLSCASPGNCLAGGDFGWPYSWAFVASEKNGVWGQAIAVPGLGALVNGRWASLLSVSCASAGNCAIGGDDENMTSHGDFTQAFAAIRQPGRWDQATRMPGLAALNKNGSTSVASVSCGSADVCTAAGYYTDRHGHLQGFVTQSDTR
jgi:hypothetical protein